MSEKSEPHSEDEAEWVKRARGEAVGQNECDVAGCECVESRGVRAFASGKSCDSSVFLAGEWKARGSIGLYQWWRRAVVQMECEMSSCDGQAKTKFWVTIKMSCIDWIVWFWHIIIPTIQLPYSSEISAPGYKWSLYSQQRNNDLDWNWFRQFLCFYRNE